MKTVSQYPSGMFSWVDMNSTNTEAAAAFYAAVFGWEGETNPMPQGGTYTMFKIDGHDVAGMGGMPPGTPDGVPSHWNSYVTVEDLDGAVTKVSELGGNVIMAAMDVMEAGRMAVAADPTGAIFSMWQPKDHIGSSVVNYPNSLVWNEINTRDAEAAATFYSGLFGWEHHIDPTPEGGYHMFMKDGRAQAGMLIMDEKFGDMPANWMPYFRVANMAESQETVTNAGGSFIVGPFAMGMGHMGVVQDPAGAVFTIMEFNEGMVDPPPGHDSW